MVAGGELVRLAHQFVLDYRGQKTAPVGVPGKADLVRVEAKIRYRRLKASSQLIEAFGDARIETAFVGRKDHVVTPASEIGEQSAVVGGVADGTGVAMSEEHRRQRRIDGQPLPGIDSNKPWARTVRQTALVIGPRTRPGAWP